MGHTNGTVLELVPSQLCDLSQFGGRFNLVIVSEGYGGRSELWQSQFEADANRVIKQLQTTAPFMNHLDALNIFLLHVYSEEEGAARSGTEVRSYFGATFAGTSPGSDRPSQLLLVDEPLVYETVAAQLAELALQSNQDLGPPHKIIVLVNTPFDGGSGGSGYGIAVASRAMEIRTALHELGHAFGLVDEYPHGGAGVGPNLSHTHAPLPWEAQAAATPQPTLAGATTTLDTVGAFTDPDFERVAYRSQWLCRMRYCCHPAFCRACSNYISEQLQHFSP
ncbi:MAG TPA: M64 family metallopeptidase [Kofleriaceae bacterium]|nr:M64 family metallopeptidase [Kofleriaceae bacterium]